ncbi:MAG: hydrogenase maturation protease [Gammaproteobacteria bacterium]|jgi:hydrogenase maturation protease
MSGGRTCVIGIGQPCAGDDSAGLAIVRALRDGAPLPAGVEVHETTDPGCLVELLDGVRHAILVDAIVGDGRPGTLRCLTPDALVRYPRVPFSSHGLGVAEAIALARALAPAGATLDIRLVAVAIAAPYGPARSLSPPVAASVPRAALLVRELLAGGNTRPRV